MLPAEILMETPRGIQFRALIQHGGHGLFIGLVSQDNAGDRTAWLIMLTIPGDNDMGQ